MIEIKKSFKIKNSPPEALAYSAYRLPVGRQGRQACSSLEKIIL